MSPTDKFVARTNIARVRQQIVVEQDPVTMATLQRLLDAQIETLRAGEASEGLLPSTHSEES